MDIQMAISEVRRELERATAKFDAFRSPHEGYAIMLEELEELWETVKDKGGRLDEMREEAVQVAAMSLRFLLDCC